MHSSRSAPRDRPHRRLRSRTVAYAGEPRVRRIKSRTRSSRLRPQMRHPRIVAILRDLLGPAVRWDQVQAQHEIARLRRGGRVASGLGVLSAHQRRPLRRRRDDGRLRHGKRAIADRPAATRVPSTTITSTATSPVRWIRPDARSTSSAVPCLGRAGSLSIYHVRAVHGSAVNTWASRAVCCSTSTAPPTPGH